MELDETSKKILEKCCIFLSCEEEQLVDRDQLLNSSLYFDLKSDIEKLKKKFSSSFLTSLHKEAELKQKWPLLNLVRQILHLYNYKMTPIRKSDGYTKDGAKKYRRYFLIQKNIK
jgi:hypothetical protein